MERDGRTDIFPYLVKISLDISHTYLTDTANTVVVVFVFVWVFCFFLCLLTYILTYLSIYLYKTIFSSVHHMVVQFNLILKEVSYLFIYLFIVI